MRKSPRRSSQPSLDPRYPLEVLVNAGWAVSALAAALSVAIRVAPSLVPLSSEPPFERLGS
jgi:hypothetical protein